MASVRGWYLARIGYETDLILHLISESESLESKKTDEFHTSRYLLLRNKETVTNMTMRKN